MSFEIKLTECNEKSIIKTKDKTNITIFYQAVGPSFNENFMIRKITTNKQYNNSVSNISILLWQHFGVLLDHLQASIQRYEVQSLHITYCRIP